MPDTTTRLPKAVLGYLDVALSGPLASGVVAHRRVSTTIHRPANPRKHHAASNELVSVAACAPKATEERPAVPCQVVGAYWADQHGAVACTAAECFPPVPGGRP